MLLLTLPVRNATLLELTAERLRLRGLQKPEQHVQPEGGLDLSAWQELKRRRRQNRVVDSDSD